MSFSFDLTGRTALVTGASSGLGMRFGRILAANGARVALGARRKDRLEALAAEIGPNAAAIRMDGIHSVSRAGGLDFMLLWRGFEVSSSTAAARRAC